MIGCVKLTFAPVKDRMPRPSLVRDVPTEDTVPESVKACSGLWTVTVWAPAANVPAPESVRPLTAATPGTVKLPATE